MAETTARTRTAHNNTDESNRFCYCAIGENHGNTPAATRELVLRSMLRDVEIELVSDHAYTLVRPVDIKQTPKVRAILEAFGFRIDRYSYRLSSDPGGRGIRLHASLFVR